jgi:DNA-binding CsgD family transcriptional regulator
VGGGPATDERVVAAAFLSVIERVSAQAPVLLVIDDAQWLDASSRAVVRFAAWRLSGPVGLLVTARSGEPSTTDVVLWLQLPHPDAVTRLRMSPLTLGGLHTLISARLGRVLPRPMMTRIHEISSGNPLYASELARAVAAGHSIDHQLPDTLATLVAARVQGVDAETSRLLLAAASTPVPTVELVAAATATPAQRVVELLESGDAARIVAISGNQIRFAHPLLATGVYTGAAPADRRETHRRLAECVEVPELRARHLASAAVSGDPNTLAALDAAAALTRNKGAPAAAAELLGLAIGLGGDTPLRRILAAQHHFEAGSIAAARQHLDGTAARLPSGVLRGAAVMLQGAVDGYDGSFTAAVEALSEGVAQVADYPALRLRGLMLLAPAIGIAGRMGEAVELAREALRCADDLGDPALRSQARAVYLHMRFVHGMGLDQVMLREALQWQGDADPVSVNMRADAVAALADSWIGELDRAERGMRTIKQRVIERGSEIDAVWVDSHATRIDIWAGNLRQAALIADEQEHRAEQLGGHHARVAALTCRAAVAAYAGQVDQARTAAIDAIQISNDTGGYYLAHYPAISLAFLEVSLGNYGAALTVLEPLLGSFEPDHGTEMVVGGWLPDAIEALTGLGRVDEADVLVKALHDNGVRVGRAWMLAMAARGRALCLAARGDLPGAEDAAVEAMEHHRRLPMPFETARTQLLLGQLQRRRRHKSAATETLREALSSFEDIGTPLWAQRARVELGRVEGTADGRGAGLTPAELRIATRAVAGLSNKEIAGEQFLALKTVEMTLSSVYRKLGIRSRTQLHSRLEGVVARDIPGSPSPPGT